MGRGTEVNIIQVCPEPEPISITCAVLANVFSKIAKIGLNLNGGYMRILRYIYIYISA